MKKTVSSYYCWGTSQLLYIFFPLLLVLLLTSCASQKPSVAEPESLPSQHTREDSLAKAHSELVLQYEDLMQVYNHLRNNLTPIVHPNHAYQAFERRQAMAISDPNTPSAEVQPIIRQVFVSDTVVQESVQVVSHRTRNTHIAFHCPETMREDRTYELRAMLAVIMEEEELMNELLLSVNRAREELREEPISLSDIQSREVSLAQYIQVDLIDPAEKFTVVNTSGNDGKPVAIYDFETDQYLEHPIEWIWNVTPKPETRGRAVLVLVITPFDGNMTPLPKEQRRYAIDIKLKQSFLSSSWELANRNPEWAFATIIIPVLTFLWGLFINRRKRRTEVK